MRHDLNLPSLLLAALVAGAFSVGGCMSVPERHPLPAALSGQARVPGGAEARSWGDAPPPLVERWLTLSAEELRRQSPGIVGRAHHYLAISGDGPDGAYGAGLLCGWSAAGTRPEFTVVTGISTGALIAPFAFLGSAFDPQLRRLFTQTTTKDFLEERSTYGALTSDAAAGNEPLRKLIAELITDEVVQAIAVESRRGRHLIIGTTDLDAGRPVRWDIGRIAASGEPGAADLIRQVVLASASVPGAFPPVFIEVEAGGATYDEMHVDGSASAQIYLHPSGIDWERVLEKLQVPGRPNVYLIRNSRFAPRYAATGSDIFSVVGRSMYTMIRTLGIANMVEIHQIARRDDLAFHLAFVPADFDHESKERFDPAYMSALFQVGFDPARKGYSWQEAPPQAGR